MENLIKMIFIIIISALGGFIGAFIVCALKLTSFVKDVNNIENEEKDQNDKIL